jgi:hypothetical protein
MIEQITLWKSKHDKKWRACVLSKSQPAPKEGPDLFENFLWRTRLEDENFRNIFWKILKLFSQAGEISGTHLRVMADTLDATND